MIFRLNFRILNFQHSTIQISIFNPILHICRSFKRKCTFLRHRIFIQWLLWLPQTLLNNYYELLLQKFSPVMPILFLDQYFCYAYRENEVKVARLTRQMSSKWFNFENLCKNSCIMKYFFYFRIISASYYIHCFRIPLWRKYFMLSFHKRSFLKNEWNNFSCCDCITIISYKTVC
jgi:hypothetical protein